MQDAGTTTNQVEEIISELPVYCFKAGIDVDLIAETHRIVVENCKIAQSVKLEDVLKIVLTDDN